MSQPSIRKLLSNKTPWEMYQIDIFIVISKALSKLLSRPNLRQNETVLNRELFFCFEDVCYELELNHHIPTPEGYNPPDSTDEERVTREGKRPDFYWQFADHIERRTRRFVVECKRLGQPTEQSPSWKLNENYVNNGIRRFLVKEWGYGQGDTEGAMIGYIETMSHENIFTEINQAVKEHTVTIDQITHTISHLTSPTDGWQSNGTSRLENNLERPFPKSPFKLYHFWLDMRDCYPRKSPNPHKEI